ncbi:unnamed protein product (macronuclear) [Paramecium tetraurelia]|uniref:Palmitoyltransferase n=1 Tax=Paramecium tetraurelia TaxID=5888 RepID=A0BLW2_PARTE|nr:uncharacterized protein GSPATT00030163001 [Paramecium tetraurelia]CAK59529.1 unnamed protein product [Paramecium tetraurelia]|eukprot:XP_001426927.1 hypothetical protein (macronuclear) [Paramecium tetraurelia strain d4-2]
MFPNISVLNEEFDEDQPRLIAVSYSDIKKLLSPPPAKIQPEIIVDKHKAKSHTYGLIESKGVESHLIKIIQNNDQVEIQNVLDEVENINIQSIIDHKKYTLLHLAAYNNNLDTVKMLINHVKKQHKHKCMSILTEWVNQQTEDGFVAFHFAAYRGNLDMIHEFEKCGANLYILNAQGMNGLHLAAQGDQPKSVVYFKKIGFDFAQKDSKGGTALHWASYYGCELAVNYLLSFTDQFLDIKDLEGLTALHLATMSGNSRIVKKLLLHGANRNIKNNEGQTAADIAKSNSFQSIYKMLTESQNFFITYFSISQGFQKVDRSKGKMIKFVAMLIYCQAIIIYSNIYAEESYLYIIYYGVPQLIIWLLLILIWLSNPGKQIVNQEKSEQEQLKNLFEILKISDAKDICPECVCVKDQRSKHCDICQSCVLVYDHHCPWVDNCIGQNNHFQFYIFVLLLCLDITVTLTFQFYFVIKEIQIDGSVTDSYIILFVLSIFSIIIMLLFLFPLWLLLYIQTMNLLSGQTTYEKYSQSMKKAEDKSTVSCNNCLQMCFYNKRDSRQKKKLNHQSMQLYDSNKN